MAQAVAGRLKGEDSLREVGTGSVFMDAPLSEPAGVFVLGMVPLKLHFCGLILMPNCYTEVTGD